mgnify:CR=1 FL=1
MACNPNLQSCLTTSATNQVSQSLDLAHDPLNAMFTYAKTFAGAYVSPSYNQKLIIEALAKNPKGMFSRHLSHKTGVSNKSDTIKRRVRELLAKHDLEIRTKRIPEKAQWLWSLNHISSGE